MQKAESFLDNGKHNTPEQAGQYSGPAYLLGTHHTAVAAELLRGQLGGRGGVEFKV